MPTNSTGLLGAFIVGRLLAENVGLSSSQATQWAAVLMATGLSPASILLVLEFARRDAVDQPANQTRQLSDLSRQTNQTVAQIQQVNQQAAVAAQVAQQAATHAKNAQTAAEAALLSEQNTQKAVEDVHQAVAIAIARLDELDRRTREEAARLRQSNTNILNAVHKLQDSPRSQTTRRPRKDDQPK